MSEILKFRKSATLSLNPNGNPDLNQPDLNSNLNQNPYLNLNPSLSPTLNPSLNQAKKLQTSTEPGNAQQSKLVSNKQLQMNGRHNTVNRYIKEGGLLNHTWRKRLPAQKITRPRMFS